MLVPHSCPNPFCAVFFRLRLPALLCLLISHTHGQNLPDRAAGRAEIAEKLNRVQRFLTEQQLAGVLLYQVGNVAWVTAGLGDNHILLTSQTGPAALLVLRDGRRYVVGPKTETDHLMAENFAELGYQPLAYGWYENPDRRQTLVDSVAGGPVGTDALAGRYRLVDNDFARLRYQLTDSEAQKYRWVCRQASESVAQVCRTLRPGQTEKQIEAQTIAELVRRGLEPTVVLIGSDERLSRFYHYPPTDKPVVRHVFVNVCARRWGLITSVGRYVHFGPVPDSLKRNLRASATICAHLQAATKVGARAADLFRLGQQQYVQQGFPDGWQRIHFGGAIGYAEREWVATATSPETVLARQAFAWNPFTSAALSFDTVWLDNDSSDPTNQPENLTALPDWPTLTVSVNGRTYRMPDILVRPMPK